MDERSTAAQSNSDKFFTRALLPTASITTAGADEEWDMRPMLCHTHTNLQHVPPLNLLQIVLTQCHTRGDLWTRGSTGHEGLSQCITDMLDQAEPPS